MRLLGYLLNFRLAAALGNCELYNCELYARLNDNGLYLTANTHATVNYTN